MWCEEEKEDGEEKKEREDEEEKKGDEGAAELLVRCSSYFFDSPSVQVTVIPSQRISFPSFMLSCPTHVSMVSHSCPDTVPVLVVNMTFIS